MRILILSLILLSSCSTLSASPEQALVALPDTYSGQADMTFTIDKIAYSGTAVLPSKTGMIFRFNLPKDTSKLFLTTCHRKMVIDKPVNPYEFQYLMRSHLEDVGSCILKAEALVADGTVKKAIIDFVDKETMPAFSSCNGSTVQTTGASLCQAPISLRQMIQVSGDVDAVGMDKCADLSCNAIWCYYNISPGFCVYRIVDLKTRQVHRLTTYGY